MVHAGVFATLAVQVVAQQVGTVKKEFHPSLPIGVCTGDGCVPESTTVVLDANWRWIHNVGGYENCYDNMTWNASFCPDSDSCCKDCALDGVPEEDWSAIYGVNASKEIDGGLQLGLQQGGNVGSRFYFLDAADDSKYRMFYLKNREFAFDVDQSTIGCGVNGALYFVEMQADGGVASSKDGLNSAGANYGTGYCDAQCASDIKFIGGVANIENPPYGSCCAEMDIWEANNQATAFTAHPCGFEGQIRCDGSTSDCETACDKGGCDFNSYRNGVQSHFGPGSDFSVDSTKPVTVVTQFITSDGTDSGDLVEVRRFYVQDGKKISNAMSDLSGVTPFDSLMDDTCAAQKEVFGEGNDFKSQGGLKGMGDAMERGMVLVMSIWDDHAANMLWLDSIYPPSATGPGAERGPCATDSGNPSDVEDQYGSASVTFANVRFGKIGTTQNAVVPAPPSPVPPSPSQDPCCSWDAVYCGDTSDYCNGNAGQCSNCGGGWCTTCLPPYGAVSV